MQWKTRRILVLGMTYPSYSRTYQENACTGGVDEATGELVRIHPVPMRYLEPKHQFRAFQWIEVRTKPHPSDPRPESLLVDPRSIALGDIISSSDHIGRRRWLEQSPHFVKSVEDLKERNRENQVSLGVMAVTGQVTFDIPKSTDREREEWLQRESVALAQENLFGENPKPLDFPDLKFLVNWRCVDERCRTEHRMKLLDWGIHELARKYRGRADRILKISELMEERLDTRKRDVFLYLGNFRGVMYNFGLMGAWSAPKQVQQDLFK